jgi:hypothetical protein
VWIETCNNFQIKNQCEQFVWFIVIFIYCCIDGQIPSVNGKSREYKRSVIPCGFKGTPIVYESFYMVLTTHTTGVRTNWHSDSSNTNLRRAGYWLDRILMLSCSPVLGYNLKTGRLLLGPYSISLFTICPCHFTLCKFCC